MRKTILIAVTAFVMGGAATGALIATAQPAPPPPGGPGMDGTPPHHPMMGWMHRHHGPGPGGQMTFALVYRQKDRNLSPADVQKIAEAFLLWRGNHTWKVTGVTPEADGAIAFSLSSPEGSVIASFTMDPHTGQVTRTG